MSKSSKSSKTSLDLSVINDYDFFENNRNKYLNEKEKEDKLEKEIRRQKQKEESLSWRKEGIDLVNSLKHSTSNFSSILLPHQCKKTCMIQLNSYYNELYMSSVLSKESNKARRYYVNNYVSSQLLRILVPEYYKRCRIKTNIIDQKFRLQEQIRYSYKLKYPVKYIYTPPIPEIRTVRYIYRIYMLSVTVEHSFRKKLKEKRYKYRKARDKLQRVHDTMRSCQAILVCPSVNHDDVKGCPVCHVIYRGGEMDTVMYVKSISRDTGVETLVTLDFEIETLNQEEIVGKSRIKKIEDDLFPFEDVIFSKVIVEIQWWVCLVLSFKRYVRKRNKSDLSLKKYKRNKVLLMSKEVNKLIPQPQPIDMEYFKYKYSSIVSTVIKYITNQVKRKENRILKYAEILRSKIKKSVEVTRIRKYEEYLLELKLAEEAAKREKPIIIRKIPLDPIHKPEYICYRTECKLREFLTEERYTVHMNIHKKEDDLKLKKNKSSKIKKLHREEVEKVFLSRVKESREYITKSDFLFDDCDVEFASKHKANINVKDIVFNTGIKSTSLMLKTSSFRHDLIGEKPSLGDVEQETDYDEMKIKQEWVIVPHIYTLNALYKIPMLSLELVSKQEEVDVPYRLPLDRPIVRIGTHSSCECIITMPWKNNDNESKISKIHCIFYCPMFNNNNIKNETLGNLDKDNNVTLVDNNSLFGTYTVSVNGTKKVSKKISSGVVLSPGMLVCIGVYKEGPETLSATEANGACIVYRVRCLDKET